jgi:hypothetical protein
MAVKRVNGSFMNFTVAMLIANLLGHVVEVQKDELSSVCLTGGWLNRLIFFPFFMCQQ